MIRTDHLQRRNQVFVSSTYLDLKKERDEVLKALTLNKYIVEGMELFPAANKKQWDVIKERIDKSDLYVLIIASRFGSVAEQAAIWEPGLAAADERLSYTQLEFRYARSKGKPVLAFVKEKRENEEAGVQGLIKEVQHSDLTTAYWTNPSNLVSKVLGGLSTAAGELPTNGESGWIRADSLATPVGSAHSSVFLESKSFYAKFVSHSSKANGAQPLYRKFIHRLGKEFDVWDEYSAITVSRFSHYLSDLQFFTRTDGDAVDFTVLQPYVDKLSWTDLKEGLRDNIVNPHIMAPSNIYVIAASFLNGFQDGNTDLGVKASHPARSLRLTADFSSIPGYAKRFVLIKAVEVGVDQKEQDITDQVQKLPPGVFSVERRDVPKDHVLRFDFDVR